MVDIFQSYRSAPFFFSQKVLVEKAEQHTETSSGVCFRTKSKSMKFLFISVFLKEQLPSIYTTAVQNTHIHEMLINNSSVFLLPSFRVIEL